MSEEHVPEEQEEDIPQLKAEDADYYQEEMDLLLEAARNGASPEELRDMSLNYLREELFSGPVGDEEDGLGDDPEPVQEEDLELSTDEMERTDDLDDLMEGDDAKANVWRWDPVLPGEDKRWPNGRARATNINNGSHIYDDEAIAAIYGGTMMSTGMNIDGQSAQHERGMARHEQMEMFDKPVTEMSNEELAEAYVDLDDSLRGGHTQNEPALRRREEIFEELMNRDMGISSNGQLHELPPEPEQPEPQEVDEADVVWHVSRIKEEYMFPPTRDDVLNDMKNTEDSGNDALIQAILDQLEDEDHLYEDVGSQYADALDEIYKRNLIGNTGAIIPEVERRIEFQGIADIISDLEFESGETLRERAESWLESVAQDAELEALTQYENAFEEIGLDAFAAEEFARSEVNSNAEMNREQMEEALDILMSHIEDYEMRGPSPEDYETAQQEIAQTMPEDGLGGDPMYDEWGEEAEVGNVEPSVPMMDEYEETKLRVQQAMSRVMRDPSSPDQGKTSPQEAFSLVQQASNLDKNLREVVDQMQDWFDNVESPVVLQRRIIDRFAHYLYENPDSKAWQSIQAGEGTLTAKARILNRAINNLRLKLLDDMLKD